MFPLKSNKIKLRAPETIDLDFLYEIENDPTVWEVSNHHTPLSKYVLEQYLLSAHLDIYTVKQLRLMICDTDNKTIGTIDLFDFDPQHLRAGIGIFILEKERNKGMAREALKILCEYAFLVLGLQQLFCGISPSNIPSKNLFESFGFILQGQKKAWRKKLNGEYEDELFYQLLKSNFKA